jgi:leucine dehydrogenase
MTYKAALAGLPLGGGKSIIFGDPKTMKNEAFLESFASFVESLGGRYITSVDSGTTPHDLDIFSRRTKHVTGCTPEFGGAGDPSPMTAIGVFEGVRASVKHVFGTDDLKGRTVAIQGVGNVGESLATMLTQAGSTVSLTDRDETKAKALATKIGAKFVSPDKILEEKCDVLAPCALGGVINDNTIGKLNCKIVAGAANNPLSSIEIGEKLHQMGIPYAPDFAINAGGLIHVAQELKGYDPIVTEKKTREIYNTITNIFDRSKKENIPTAVIARKLAKEILENS